MEELLERLLEECRPCTGAGRVADYIPELAKEDPDALGVYVIGSEQYGEKKNVVWALNS